MLANDPDEALDQAELLLKERSLTAYYDEIALKGLQLAVNDAQRGVLTADQVERTNNSIRSLEISGSPAHLRYLIRRLRGRLPTGTPILVGLWPAEDQVLHDHGLQGLVGADYYTTSLGEAVEICVRVAHEQAAEASSAVADRTSSAKIIALAP